jgi:hypothetical protein
MKRSRVHRVMTVLFSIALIGACMLPLTLLAAGQKGAKDDATTNSDNAPSGNHAPDKIVWIDTHYFATAGETLQVNMYFYPPLKNSGTVTLDPGWGLTFSPSTFVLGPGENKSVQATVPKGFSGVAWVHASSSAPGYGDSWFGIAVDFEAALKLSSHSTIPYDSPTTFTIAMTDKAGGPVRMPAHLGLHLEYADGQLRSEDSDWSKDGRLDLWLTPGSETSPTFQLRSTLRKGGSGHLLATLFIPNQDQALAQQDFPLQADPAMWLTILLAVMGGLLHGVYKVLRLEEETPGKQISKAVFMLLGSGLAGLIGYLFAHFDLLGLKIDPNVLRSYPLIGFLFSYFGFEVLLPKRGSAKDGPADPDAADANPKG